MRTKNQVYCLSGHENTVGCILAQDENPQLVTGSYDSTVRLWDLSTGKTIHTLTHHKKGVRAMAMHKKEFAFVSASADNIKKFSCHGDFMHNMLSQQKSIVNAMAMNDDDVIFTVVIMEACAFGITNLGTASKKKKRSCNRALWRLNVAFTHPLSTLPALA